MEIILADRLARYSKSIEIYYLKKELYRLSSINSFKCWY